MINDDLPTPAAPAATVTTTPRERRRAQGSSFIGSAVEYYDFLLYAAAAGLVFPDLFFSGVDHGTGVLLSYLTLFTGYISRPIGGLLFGHFGDKIGRKKMLVITLLVMGIVSMVIGLMPTAASIGIAAPILLAVLRLVQGLAVGGEWAGAMLMSGEHSTTGTKGFGASLAMAGAPFGAVMATFVLAVTSGLAGPAFVEWAWRIPFLLSAVVVAVGLYMRTRVSESPEFEAARKRGEVHTGLPMAILFTQYRSTILFGSLAVMAPLFIQGLLAVFMVPYVVDSGAVSRETALYMLTLSNFVHIFTIPAFAALSDRLGRKQVMIGGAVFSAIAVWPMFMLFDSGNATLITIAFLVGNPLIQASMYGPVGAYLSELFEPTARYSGVSLTYQLGSLLGAGLAPLVAQRLVSDSAGTSHLAWYIGGAYVISAVAVLLSRSAARRTTRRGPIAESVPVA
ncbi:MFS transporter [Janibacter sp. Soil728]|uniref:MFS transporter n=1 Tax=Janibacter sp. Soil728 TaxID=1736393 RepID=UPI0006F88FC8|nr:MFS transporter [Janibacter sp. Soil728]KRE38229.1 MFS transporter [Janibacter sp. Soil728]